MITWVVLATSAPLIIAGTSTLVTGWIRRKQTLVLTGTVFSAIGLMGGVTGWLLVANQGAGLAEALRTGGLAGGTVVALYGLWLNDRRRRVEEDRQQLESGRLDHERFAQAIGLLGHEADQVRVGAMHALAGLARGTSSYTQTVLDVLCSYLRRPFDHPRYHEERAPELQDFSHLHPGAVDDNLVDSDRERQVRVTAMRLIAELLPEADSDNDSLYDLDLTGATLEHLDLSGRRIRNLTARRAALYGITRINNAEFHGRAMLTGSMFFGRAELQGTLFAGGASLHEVRFHHEVNLTGCSYRDFADLRAVEPLQAITADITVDTSYKVKLPGSWHLRSQPHSTIASVHTQSANIPAPDPARHNRNP